MTHLYIYYAMPDMNKLLLRYGVPAILLTMAAGVAVMLESIEIRTKSSVTLFVRGRTACTAYIAAPQQDFAVRRGDTLTVEQTPGGNVRFIVHAVRREPAATVVELETADDRWPLIQTLGGNTCAAGYIFTGKVKLRQLVIRHIGR